MKIPFPILLCFLSRIAAGAAFGSPNAASRPTDQRTPGMAFYPDGKAVRESPQSSYFSISDALDIQRALKSRGYYRGPIDGEGPPGFRKAVAAFQQHSNLPVTGNLSPRLLRRLRIR